MPRGRDRWRPGCDPQTRETFLPPPASPASLAPFLGLQSTDFGSGTRISDFLGSGVFGFWGPEVYGVLEIWKSEVLGLWGFGVLRLFGFWGSDLRRFLL